MTSQSQEATRSVVPSPTQPMGLSHSRPLYRSFAIPRITRHGLRRTTVEVAGAIAEDPSLLEGPAVAVVGARAAPRAALDFAAELGARLAERARIVVSGGAIGVDGAAHEGALSVGGRTVAVLGTGIDVAYPERHAPLFAAMLERGGLVSPFERGDGPRRSHFPARNPFIAALADAVVVVEAGLRSGSLGTARAAVALSVPLYCVPGSAGCDALIASRRAVPVVSAAGLADRLTAVGDAPVVDVDDDTLAGRVLSLCASPCDAASLAAALHEALSSVLECLIDLELSRRVMRFPDGRYLALTGSVDQKG